MQSIREIYKVGRGPSSSHTIGPERAANYYKVAHPDAEKFQVNLYGSLCKTGHGHGTDRVLRDTFAPKEVYVVFEDRTPEGVTHPNTMDLLAFENGEWTEPTRVLSIGGGDLIIDGEPGAIPPEIYDENSFAEITEYCRFRKIGLEEYVRITEGEEIMDFLLSIWQRMKQTIEEGLSAEGILPGPLQVERKAKLLFADDRADESPEIRECLLVSAYAYAVSEQNADCGVIVTAPTCGACGVVPATLYYTQQRHGLTDEQVAGGLAVAGLIGNVVKHNASIAGAECGCQAEIGTACAMAAAAMAQVNGLSTAQIQSAAEIALEHNLGLTCDSICGQVQVPCIERNAVAAMEAINAYRLAKVVSGTERIPFDFVVRTMYETGTSMSSRFKETAEGGLARMYGRKSMRK